MPFPFLGEEQQLNETTRASADGSFVRLPDGVTHYELVGPPSGSPVVLIHGFSVPYFIFDPTFDFLTASGFRVLRYDLFGRGWSDRPQLPYKIDLFVRQLRDLLDALNFTSPVALVGLSMGGPISARFTVLHPERVSRNVLIDPSGTHPVRLGGLRLLTLPLVGELLLGLFGREGFVKMVASDFFDPAWVDHFQAQYLPQIRFKGFRRAILSTIRGDALGDFSDTYHSLGALGKSTLLIWGRQDKTVLFTQSADLMKLLPYARFHPIEGVGHIPHYERPTEVNRILLEFLS